MGTADVTPDDIATEAEKRTLSLLSGHKTHAHPPGAHPRLRCGGYGGG